MPKKVKTVLDYYRDAFWRFADRVHLAMLMAEFIAAAPWSVDPQGPFQYFAATYLSALFIPIFGLVMAIHHVLTEDGTGTGQEAVVAVKPETSRIENRAEYNELAVISQGGVGNVQNNLGSGHTINVWNIYPNGNFDDRIRQVTSNPIDVVALVSDAVLAELSKRLFEQNSRDEHITRKQGLHRPYFIDELAAEDMNVGC